VADALAAAPDPQTIRDQARQILDGPEYHSGYDSVFGRIYYYLIHPGEAIGEAWAWLLGHLPWNDTGSRLVSWGVVAAFVIVVVLFVLQLLRTTTRDRGVTVMGPAISLAQSADELIDIAKGYEAAGEWRLAVRARYGASIAKLADDGVVRRQAGRTTGEYAREVERNAPDLAAAFARVTRLFEQAWYGNTVVDEEFAGGFRVASNEIIGKRVHS
jgi:hypothetical protein